MPAGQMPEGADRRTRIAAFISLAPIVYGVAFAAYAFLADSVTHTVISVEGETISRKTIAEAGDGAGVILALAPFACGVFVAVLLRLARRDSDTAPLWMAWIFSGLIALAGLASVTSVGRYIVLPAILMLGATWATHSVVLRTRR